MKTSSCSLHCTIILFRCFSNPICSSSWRSISDLYQTISNILMMISYKLQRQFCINIVCLSSTPWKIGYLLVISTYFWRTTQNCLLELLVLIANWILINSLCKAQIGYLYIFWHLVESHLTFFTISQSVMNTKDNFIIFSISFNVKVNMTVTCNCEKKYQATFIFVYC